MTTFALSFPVLDKRHPFALRSRRDSTDCKLLGMVCLWGMMTCIATGAEILVDAESLSAQVAQAGSAVLELEVSSDGDLIEVVTSSTAPWLTTDPAQVTVASGQGARMVSVTFSPGMLMPGTYQGQVQLTSSGASNSPRFVLSEMTVTQVEHALNVFPTNIAVTQIEGEAEPEGYLMVKNDGYGALSFDLDGDSVWMVLDETSGTSTGDWVQVGIRFENIPLGVSTGYVTVYAGQTTPRSPWAVPVVASHLPPPPTMMVSTHELSVTGVQESAAVQTSFNLGPEDPELENYVFTAVSYDSWLTVSPTSGVFHGTPQAISLTLNPAGLAPGVHYGAVTVEQTGTDNREVVSVEFTVNEASRVLAQGGVWNHAIPAGTVITQQVAVWNAGTGAMSYEFGNLPFWINVTPLDGSSSGGTNWHEVVFDSSALFEGTNEREVQLTSTFAVNTPLLLPASLTVQGNLQSDVSSLSIKVQQTAGPTSVPFQVWNAGSPNAIEFTLSHDSTSFSLSGYGGFSSGEPVDFFMEVVPGELDLGVHNGAIKIQGPGGFEMDIPVQISIDPEEDTYEEAMVFSLREDGDWNIWRVRPDGSGARPLIQRAGDQTSPRISPDGNRLLFREARSGMANRIVVYDLRTSAETYLDDLESPRWMPDSLRVAGVEDIGTAKNPRGGRVRALPLEGREGRALYFSMTPFRLFGVDSQNRVMLVQRPRRAPSTILRYDPRTKKSAVVLSGADCDDSNGAISFDGTYTVFQSDAGANPKALRMRVAHGFTTQPVRDADAAVQRWPALSPTASRIAIVREEANDFAICTADANGNNFAVLFEADDGDEIAELDWGMLAQNRNRITVSPTRIETQAYAGSTNLLTETFTVQGKSGMTLSYGITGGSARMPHNKPNGGTSTGQTETVTLTAAPRNMAEGLYRARYQVVGNAGNAPVRVEWWLRLLTRPPDLRIVYSDFAQAQSVASEVVYKPLEIIREGDGEASWQLVSHAPWLTFSSTSGTVSAAQAYATMLFDSTGLGSGTHTGRFDFVRVMPLGNITESYTTEFYAYDTTDTNPPALSVSTTNINATTTRGRNATSQYFHVWNSGGNGEDGDLPLAYTFHIANHSGASDWLQISPRQGNYESRGERDVYEVRFNTAGLTAQPLRRDIEIYPSGDTSAKQTIQVSLTLEPALRFALNLQNPANLTLHADPAPGVDGKYDDKTAVRVWAVPAYGYDLDRWTGDAQGFETQVVVRVDGDKTVSATTRKRTLLLGVVTNAFSGEIIEGATVTLSAGGFQQSAPTAAGGAERGTYSFEPPTSNAELSFEAPGYLPARGLKPSIQANEWNEFNVGLDPVIFRYIDFFHPNEREMIFRYTINGRTGMTYRVDMDISYDGGLAWYSPSQYPLYVSGDIATNVTVGRSGQKHFSWHVADNAPMINIPEMRVRLKAAPQAHMPQQFITSQTFRVNTRKADNPTILAYYDNNDNGKFDIGEALNRAEIYIGGRTKDHLRGYTGGDGLFTWQGGGVYPGDVVFARHKFATRKTEKGYHGPVDDLMYTIWLDSDVGTRDDQDNNHWDGVWRSYVLTDSHITQMAAGRRLELPLNHVLYEWNLTVSCPYDDELILGNLANSIEAGSKYLYQITDGQMKLDKVYIRSTGGNLKRPDLRVRKSTKRANADIDGIYDSADDAHIRMGYYGLTNAGNAVAYGKTLIHELGHYALGVWDEYRSYRSEDAFPNFVSNHPNLYPENYGAMDDQQNATSLSSPNDYLSSKQAYGEAVTAELGITRSNQLFFAMLNQNFVTEQYYRHSVDCWDFMRRRFVKKSGGLKTRLMTQRSGVFINGTSTVPDRSSSDVIMPPYNICQIRFNNDPYELRRRSSTAGDAMAPSSGTILLRVTEAGAPVTEAHVAMQRPASIPLEPVGRTGTDGQMRLSGLSEGDTIIVHHAGQRVRHVVQRADIGREVHIAWETLLRRTARSSTPLTVLITGEFDAQGDYQFVLHPDIELSGAPEVTAYADEETVHPIAMQSIGGSPARWQGTLPMTNGNTWTIDIAALATNGSAYYSVDMATVLDVSTNGYTAQALVFPFDELRARETTGLTWQQNQGPLPAMPGVFIPPAVHFSLADRSLMSSNAAAQLSIEYEDDLPGGLDETTIALYRWDAATQAWTPEPHRLNLPARRIEATITNAGPYALFAQTTTDVTPPAAITGLYAEVDTSYLPRIHLSWTATGDDGTVGTASAYELIQSSEPITEENIATLPAYTLGMAPAPSGTAQTYTFEPAPEILWYFALRARDKAGNVSPFSNIASATPSRPIEEGEVFPAQYLETMALRGYPDLDPDGDEDNDGLSNIDEFLLRTDPLNADSDGDGMPDGYEAHYGLDPLDASDAWGDLDNDGIPNITEKELGTDPSRASTLDDGIGDGWKQRYGFPLISEMDVDDDEDLDTFSTLQEYIADTDPFDGNSYLDIDRILRQPGAFVVYLNASTQRLFGVQGSADLSDSNAWTTLLAPNPGSGANTPLTITATNGLKLFRIHAEMP